MTITVNTVPLPDGWHLDPDTRTRIEQMRPHEIRYAANVWREAERMVAQHYPRPATSGASSHQEAS